MTTYELSASDILLALDQNKFGFHVPVLESLSVTDSIHNILAILSSEELFLNSTASSTWKGVETAISKIYASDLSALIKGFHDTVAESLSVSDLTKFAFQLLVFDSIVCASSAEAKSLFYRQMQETLSLSDEALRAWEGLVSEAFMLVEAASFRIDHITAISEALGAVDGSSVSVSFNEALEETLLTALAVSSMAIFGISVSDPIAFSGSVVIDGDTWECWVLNTNKFFPSVYSGFDFNSYAVFESRAYGCKHDGIYELTGETDNGNTVHTGLTIPETAFGVTNKKRFRKALLGIMGDSPVIKVENENDYAFYPLNTNEATINRSMHGKKWSFSALDFDRLHFIELIPVILTR